MPHPLASIKNPTPYWHKYGQLDLSDFEWNIPEQPSGELLLLGGNSQIFAPEVKVGEFLSANYPLKSLRLLFPDSLSAKLPKDPRFIFAPSTPSGSFAKSPELAKYLSESSATLIFGDLTRNPVTSAAIVEAINQADAAPAKTPAEAPLLLTRDAVDLLAPQLINHPHLMLVASLSQLQKLFQALYYPKILLLSMPILPVVEALHKFTLSYPTELLTFHDGQILVARSGQIASLPITKTPYTPLSLWQGPLAAKYLALSLYNPGGLIS